MNTYTFMNISLMNYDTNREAKCINHNVFLASFDHLAAINTMFKVNVVGGFDASCINDSYAEGIFPPHQLSEEDMQGLDLILKYAFQLPFFEVVEDCAEGRKFHREHTALASRFDYTHDSVHNVPEIVLSFGMLRIQDNFSNLPLFISKVSCILTCSFNWMVLIMLRKNVSVNLQIFNYLRLYWQFFHSYLNSF